LHNVFRCCCAHDLILKQAVTFMQPSEHFALGSGVVGRDGCGGLATASFQITAKR
jgi:hypothetical protein